MKLTHCGTGQSLGVNDHQSLQSLLSHSSIYDVQRGGTQTSPRRFPRPDVRPLRLRHRPILTKDQDKLAHDFFLPGAYIYSSVHVFCIVLVLVYQYLILFLVYLSPVSINVPRPS